MSKFQHLDAAYAGSVAKISQLGASEQLRAALALCDTGFLNRDMLVSWPVYVHNCGSVRDGES